MRDYGIVSPKFWIGETGKSLRGDANAQVLALYLMTSPHANMIGVFYCPVIYMAHETGMGLEGATKALRSLIKYRFCSFDHSSDTVFVRRMAAYQIAEFLKPGDNRIKGVEREWLSIGAASLRAEFYDLYADAFRLPKQTENASPFEAPLKPLRSQDQDQEQEQEQEQTLSAVQSKKPARCASAPGSAAPIPAGDDLPAISGELLPAEVIPRPSPNPPSSEQAACRATWAAYSGAYLDRYGVEPVRNAKVNAAIKGFTRRIGADESPDVARYYVGHSDAYYARKCHDAGAMLADAEKLRTEWATKRQVTGVTARQQERSGTMRSAVERICAEREAAA